MNIPREEAKKYVGEGWSGLIDRIYDVLPEDAQVCDIKEKLGGLRFSAHGVSEEIHDFIWDMELESMKICEFCGSPGKPRDGAWIKTLCDECKEKRSK